MKSILELINRGYVVGQEYTLADLPPGSMIIWKLNHESFFNALADMPDYKWIVVDVFKESKVVTGTHSISKSEAGWAWIDTKVYYCGHTEVTEKMISKSDDYAIEMNLKR